MNNKFPLYLVLVIALSGAAGIAFADDDYGNTGTSSVQLTSRDLPEIAALNTSETTTAREDRQHRTEVRDRRGAFGSDELDWIPSSWYSAY